MSKVLVLGSSPLPMENEMSLSGDGIRTWQFVQPLVGDGHQVCVICFYNSTAYKQKNSELLSEKKEENLTYYFFPQERFNEIPYIQCVHDNFNPDCIITISSFSPSYVATQLRTDKPMWFDRGDLMSEAQLKADIDNNDDLLYYFWKLEELVLERGDVFSSVSSPQKFALIGRLGGAGRLDKYTVGYDFVYVIPCGVVKRNVHYSKNIFRGKFVNEDDFVILWAGGYNTWTDIDTLFIALEKVMSENKKIKFVSIGGKIAGQNDRTYPRFIQLINNSEYKDRYIMLGWVPTEDLANIYKESNLGINIDKYCYEVMLGSRYRLLDWMQACLPILTTAPSELTNILDKEKIAFTYPMGDSERLAAMILELSLKKDRLIEYAKRAKEFAENNFSFEKTTKPFRDWVKNPTCAPDKIGVSKMKRYLKNLDKSLIRKIETEYIENIREQIDKLLKENRILKEQVSNISAERDNLALHLEGIESSRSYSIYMKLKQLLYSRGA